MVGGLGRLDRAAMLWLSLRRRSMVRHDYPHPGPAMSAEDLERYETEIELQLYQEYRAVLPMFRYVVETERRFYLANDVQMEAKGEGGRRSSRSSWATPGCGTCTVRPVSSRRCGS